MVVISLAEYRKTKRIQYVTARERYKQVLKERLRQRLRERMRLEELKDKQPEPPTKNPPF